MACQLHNTISVCTLRKKPRGWHNGRPAWYEQEEWVNNLDRSVTFTDRYGADVYGKSIHGELHGAKTLQEALDEF